MPTGKIIKALSGFYYIQTEDQVYQTRARGIFRKKGQSPLVGDQVEFESEQETEGVLTTIFPRKNTLIRPPVANVDVGVIVMSAVEPVFSTNLVDRFLVYLEARAIQPVLLITKLDLATPTEKERLETIRSNYQAIGYSVWFSNEMVDDQSAFLKSFQGKLLVFLGQSGVGKSTALNQLLPQLDLETGEISTALGRGRHTTRHVSLHEVEGVFIADTPGFSTVDLLEIEKEDLPHLFPEFEERAGECKFRECSHQHEPNCAIKEALEQGVIWQDRYQHYLAFYEEIEHRKPIYHRKK